LRVIANQYADDTKQHIHGSADMSLSGQMLRTSECLCAWMFSNRLRLSQRKTQLIWPGLRWQIC